MKKSWWKESIVYQIYPRSFKDSSGNGIGDINGIIEKLDYIKSLGVDIIWICPIYDSPGIDNGYDISNYKEINKDFGGNKALDELIEKVHLKGLKKVNLILIMIIISGRMEKLMNFQTTGDQFLEEEFGNGIIKQRSFFFTYILRINLI